jgi:hypothetical protein
MTDRHLSDRFERGTRERRLVRQFEIGMSRLDINRVALLDIDTRHDMLLLCDREDGYYVWIMMTDPDSYEDEVFEYSTYEAARKAFDGWEAEPLQPNWEAQAEYDELHGTVNGEDAGIVMMRELWGE